MVINDVLEVHVMFYFCVFELKMIKIWDFKIKKLGPDFLFTKTTFGSHITL